MTQPSPPSAAISGQSPRPHVLGSPTLEGLADYILSNDVHNILVLTGAGVSVAAGIPDFRSPKSGIYANLGKYNLDEPTDAFSLPLLRSNPSVFYAIAQEMNLWPGAYHPTPVHLFIKLLADEGRLLRCCTQNIDGLEREAGVPEELLVEAHGSFRAASCSECHEPYDIQKNRAEACGGLISRCEECGGVVKPNVVFFGEQLPERFFDVLMHDTPKAELVIIIGTSLQVHPFAILPLRVRPTIPRAVFNMVRVGGAMFDFPSDGVCDDDNGGNDDTVSSGADGHQNRRSPNSSPVNGAASGAAEVLLPEDASPVIANEEVEGGEADDAMSSSTATSSSDGYAQYGEYDRHPHIQRDVFFPGDCQASITQLAQCLGLGDRLAALTQTQER